MQRPKDDGGQPGPRPRGTFPAQVKPRDRRVSTSHQDSEMFRRRRIDRCREARGVRGPLGCSVLGLALEWGASEQSRPQATLGLAPLGRTPPTVGSCNDVATQRQRAVYLEGCGWALEVLDIRERARRHLGVVSWPRPEFHTRSSDAYRSVVCGMQRPTLGAPGVNPTQPKGLVPSSLRDELRSPAQAERWRSVPAPSRLPP